MCHAVAGKNACEIAKTVNQTGGRRTPFLPAKIESHRAGEIRIRPQQADGYRCDQRQRHKSRSVHGDLRQSQQRQNTKAEAAKENAAAAFRAQGDR
jgi:hypothetical protein